MLSPQTQVRRRLEEYSEWRALCNQVGEPSYLPEESVFARIKDWKENAGAGGGQHYDTIVVDGESFYCPPDGGLGRMAETIGRRIAMDNRCREVQDILQFLPEELQPVFAAAYVGLPREVPRRDRDAASRMGIGLSKYQRLKYGLLCWFCGVQFKAVAWEEQVSDVVR